jgi:Glycosyl transferase family 2
MRVVAIIATYNERRFIHSCLNHLREHEVDAYLIDDGSTDDTVAVAEQWLGRGLIGIEETPRDDDHVFSLPAQLRRKEELARELDADWFIHLDPDEIRLPPSRTQTLARALEVVDREGFNAVNFVEFTFVPCSEEPDHDHPDFPQTLLTYYPFSPRFPNQLKAWKAQDSVDLVSTHGHKVQFPGLKMHPESFPMKHYLFLSVPHAIEKYVNGRPGRKQGGWRSQLRASHVHLLSRSELRVHAPNTELDVSEPRTQHFLAETVGASF